MSFKSFVIHLSVIFWYVTQFIFAQSTFFFLSQQQKQSFLFWLHLLVVFCNTEIPNKHILFLSGYNIYDVNKLFQ